MTRPRILLWPLAMILAAPTRHWLRWLTVGWLAACAAALWYKWGGIHWFALGDTDDNVRFAQVRALLEGQGWYDLRMYRLDPPGGADIHWSRLVDLPIAGLILALRPFVGEAAAAKAAVAIAPLLPLWVAMWAGALTVRRLIDPQAWALGAVMLLAGQAALNMWLPLRIDHHGWQLAFLALTVAGMADPRRARGGVTVGLATAASLAIGLEMLPYFGVAAAALALRWVAQAGDARRLGAYGVALSAGAALGYAVFASDANRRPVCDALSPVWLSDALLGGALVLGLALVRRGDWRVRLALAAVAGAVLAGFHATLWPQCLGRPENVSPELMKLWLGHVREARPITAHPWRTGLSIAALPAAGLVGAALATRAARGTPRFAAWAATLFFGAAAFALLFWQVRAGPAAQVFAVPGAAALAWTLVPRLLAGPNAAVRVLGTVAALVLASGIWGVWVARLFPEPAKGGTRPGLAKGQPDRSRFCGTLISLSPVAKLPAGTFLTFADLGPRLIATTHHSAIAGPYHRNGPAILDVHHAWRGSAEVAHDVVRRHRVGWLMTCPGYAESTIYAAQAPRGFYMQLQRGRVPGWLRPWPLPRRSPLKLYRVVG